MDLRYNRSIITLLSVFKKLKLPSNKAFVTRIPATDPGAIISHLVSVKEPKVIK